MKLHDWRFGSLMAMLDHRDRLSRAPGRTGINQGIAGGGAPISRSAVCTAAASCSLCSSSPLSAYPCIARRAVPPEGVVGGLGQPATGGVQPCGGAGGPRCARGVGSGQSRLIGAKAGWSSNRGIVAVDVSTGCERGPKVLVRQLELFLVIGGATRLLGRHVSLTPPPAARGLVLVLFGLANYFRNRRLPHARDHRTQATRGSLRPSFE
eukprot:scaffold24412_cov63-Phaeocystis_antarctica.AAC.4